MPQNRKKIAIVGATGQVGGTLLQILADNAVSAEKILLVASDRSAGKRILYGDQVLIVQAVSQVDFSLCECAFFAAGSDVAKKYAPIAATQGCYVIDKSSYYRTHDEIPLIVPEVNGELLQQHPSKIIAVPNCSTIPLVMALKPLQDLFGLERVEVATYQAVSGAGLQGIKELEEQVIAYCHQEPMPLPHKFVAPIAFNVVPVIDQMLPTGYSKEEMKLQSESVKILQNQSLIVNATTVRVPVWIGHSEVVSIKTQKSFKIEEALRAWLDFTNLRVLLDEIPTPLTHAAGNNDVWLGRIRRHPKEGQDRITFWITTDNVRKGAAWNAWQIYQLLRDRFSYN